MLAIAGDDAQAKQAATALLVTIGYDVVDAGPLAERWHLRPDAPAYGLPYDGIPDGTWSAATAKRVAAWELSTAPSRQRQGSERSARVHRRTDRPVTR